MYVRKKAMSHGLICTAARNELIFCMPYFFRPRRGRIDYEQDRMRFIDFRLNLCLKFEKFDIFDALKKS